MLLIINIYEISPPNKISGLSSLVVKTDYNQFVVDVLKTIPTYNYDKKTKLWEFPIIYLGRLLDNLTFLDDIQLTLLNTPESSEFNFNRKYNLEPLSEIEKNSFKLKPFNHQLEAVDFGLTHEKWLLLDSPGTGKTFSTICLAETLKRRGIIDHCFIICGINALKQNWKKEIAKLEEDIEKEQANLKKLDTLNEETLKELEGNRARLKQDEELLGFIQNNDVDVKKTLQEAEDTLRKTEDIVRRVIIMKENKAEQIEKKVRGDKTAEQ